MYSLIRICVIAESFLFSKIFSKPTCVELVKMNVDYTEGCVWGGVCSRCKWYRKKVFQTSFPKRVISFFMCCEMRVWKRKWEPYSRISSILSLGKLVHIHQIGKQVENPKYNYIFYVHTTFCHVYLQVFVLCCCLQSS